MSIVIMGMEMPKTCVQCDLKRYDQERIWTDNGTELLGAWVCKRTDEIIWNTQRGENCPLLPLPAGHGRLGDLDALVSKYTEEKNKLEEWAKIHEKEGRLAMFRACHLRSAYLAEAKLNIEAAPAIVPAEGGGEMENNICFTCKHVSEYPECPATTGDIVFASNGDTIVSCKAHKEVEGGDK